MSDSNKVTLEIVFSSRFKVSKNNMVNRISQMLKQTPIVKEVRVKND